MRVVSDFFPLGYSSSLLFSLSLSLPPSLHYLTLSLGRHQHNHFEHRLLDCHNESALHCATIHHSHHLQHKEREQKKKKRRPIESISQNSRIIRTQVSELFTSICFFVSSSSFLFTFLFSVRLVWCSVFLGENLFWRYSCSSGSSTLASSTESDSSDVRVGEVSPPRKRLRRRGLASTARVSTQNTTSGLPDSSLSGSAEVQMASDNRDRHFSVQGDANESTLNPILDTLFFNNDDNERNGNSSANVDGSNQSNGNGHCSNGASNNDNNDIDDDMLSRQFETLKMQTERSPPFEFHSRMDREMIRLIGQHLLKLGLTQSARELVHESGCELDHPIATKFRAAILDGNWDLANTLLPKLRTFTPSLKSFYLMRYWILEQKFFEALEDHRDLDAVLCLRNEIVPLNFRKKKVNDLSHFIMANSLDELRDMSGWMGKGQCSRLKLLNKIQKRLPPEIMLPPERLTTMISQAFEYQKSNCLFHNQEYSSYNNPGELSLLTDHSCDREALPSECTQTLEEHVDEVWYCAFSKCGRFFATASKDRTVTVWDVCTRTFNLTLKHKFAPHPYQVGFLSWSPDSNWLLTLGVEGTSEFWVWNVQKGQVNFKINKEVDESITTADWHKDSRAFVVAGTRGHFHTVRLDIGNIIDSWEGVRIQALVCTNDDDQTVLAADTQCRIRAFVFGKNSDRLIIREEHNITSFCCDDQFHYAVVNVEMQGLHLWDLNDRVLLRKLQGNMHGYYTIHSCIGGFDQNFIASGCENNLVIVWNRHHNNPIMDLRGHTKIVNCVAWNPMFPQMLASASDDTTVKIWCSTQRMGEVMIPRMESSLVPKRPGVLDSELFKPTYQYSDSEYDYDSDEEIEEILAHENDHGNGHHDPDFDDDEFDDNDVEMAGPSNWDPELFTGGLASRPQWFNRTRCENNLIVGQMVHLQEQLHALDMSRYKDQEQQKKTPTSLTPHEGSPPVLMICDSSESEQSPSSSSSSPSSANS